MNFNQASLYNLTVEVMEARTVFYSLYGDAKTA